MFKNILNFIYLQSLSEFWTRIVRTNPDPTIRKPKPDSYTIFSKTGSDQNTRIGIEPKHPNPGGISGSESDQNTRIRIRNSGLEFILAFKILISPQKNHNNQTSE